MVFRGTLGSQVKQMLLPFSLDDPFPPASVGPALVPGELFQNGRVLLPELFIRCSRLVEHALKFPATQLGNPQETFALSRVVGDFSVAIHRGCRVPSSKRKGRHPFTTYDDT